MAYSTPGRSRERVFQFVSKRLLEGRPPTIREVQQATVRWSPRATTSRRWCARGG